MTAEPLPADADDQQVGRLPCPSQECTNCPKASDLYSISSYREGSSGGPGRRVRVPVITISKRLEQDQLLARRIAEIVGCYLSTVMVARVVPFKRSDSSPLSERDLW